MKKLGAIFIWAILLGTFAGRVWAQAPSNEINGGLFVIGQQEYFDVVVTNISDETLKVEVTFYDDQNEQISDVPIGWWQGFESQGTSVTSSNLPSKSTGLVRIGVGSGTIYGHFKIKWSCLNSDCAVRKGLVAWGRNVFMDDPVYSTARAYAGLIINLGKPF